MSSTSRILFESSWAERVLRRHDLADLDSIFRAASGARRRHVGRSVWTTQLFDDDRRPFDAFFKLSWGRRRLWPRLTDLRAGQVFQSLARREWNGLMTLEQRGFKVAPRLALLEDGLIEKRSVVAVRGVPPRASISDMVRSGAWSALAVEQKRSILQCVFETLGRIHAGGLGWRGSCSRHVYPQVGAEGGWQLWLIDCEGIHRARSRAVFERDWKKFARSLEIDGADAVTFELIDAIGRSPVSGLHAAPQPGRQRSAA
jgi:hypothetical protein